MGLRWAWKKWGSIVRSSFQRRESQSWRGLPGSWAMMSFMVLRVTPRRQREQNQGLKYSQTWGMPSCQRCPLHSAPLSLPPHPRLLRKEKCLGLQAPAHWGKYAFFFVDKRTLLLSQKWTEHRECSAVERTSDLRKLILTQNSLLATYSNPYLIQKSTESSFVLDR